jgi:hypothetical protein
MATMSTTYFLCHHFSTILHTQLVSSRQIAMYDMVPDLVHRVGSLASESHELQGLHPQNL